MIQQDGDRILDRIYGAYGNLFKLEEAQIVEWSRWLSERDAEKVNAGLTMWIDTPPLGKFPPKPSELGEWTTKAASIAAARAERLDAPAERINRAAMCDGSGWRYEDSPRGDGKPIGYLPCARCNEWLYNIYADGGNLAQVHSWDLPSEWVGIPKCRGGVMLDAPVPPATGRMIALKAYVEQCRAEGVEPKPGAVAKLTGNIDQILQ